MSLPKTILFLSDYQAPYGGSFIPSLRALEAALNARGSAVIWVFPAGARERKWCEALIAEGRRLEFLDGGAWAQWRTLDRLVRREKPGLIHAHFGYFPLARCEALLHPRLRALLHVHSDFSGGAQPPPLKRLAKTMVNGVAHRRVKRVMVGAHMAANEKDALCIENGVDFSRAAGSEGSREALRERLGVRDTDKLVLLFGWSPAIKGLDIAARAVASIKEEGFRLCVVAGREMTGKRLSAWLGERGCTAEDLLFLPPAEDVFAYHRAADVMLSASRSETFSYALAEALYTGRPCVMSDIPGTAWAAAYETVRVFLSGDAAACAEALRLAAGGYPPEAYARARDKVERDCALSRWVDGMLALYETR